MGTASVARSFSHMKMIKTHKESLGKANLSHRMKISIELPETLTDEAEQIVQKAKKNCYLTLFCFIVASYVASH